MLVQALLSALLCQTPSDSSTVAAGLTLDTAIRTAMQRTETPKMAESRVRKAEALRSQAYSNLFPTLSLTGTYRRRNQEVTREFGGQTATFQSKNALSGEARLDSTLFDARFIPVISEASEALEAQKLESSEELRGLAFEVSESFLQVLVAERTLAAAHRRVDLATEVLRSVQARFTAGLAKKSDLSRGQLELASARLAMTKAQRGVNLARLSLGYLMGRSVEEPLSDPGRITADTLMADELLRIALDERKDLLALSHRLEAAKDNASEPWMRLIPSLDLAGVTRASNETGFSGDVINWDVALNLNWTLYDGGTRYAEARARREDVQLAELTLLQQQRHVGLEIDTALEDLATARASLEEAQTQLDVAESNREEIGLLYSRGLATALEQADASVSEFEARTELERLKFELSLAELNLARAVGRWPTREGSAVD